MGCFQSKSRFAWLPHRSLKSCCSQYPRVVIPAEERSLIVLSCLQALLAADPCPLWSCARHWFTRDAVKCCLIPRDWKWIHKLWSVGVNTQSCLSRWESSVLSIGCIQGFQRPASAFFKPAQAWIGTVRKHPQNSSEWTGEKSWKSKVEIQQLCVSDPFLLF